MSTSPTADSDYSPHVNHHAKRRRTNDSYSSNSTYSAHDMPAPPQQPAQPLPMGMHHVPQPPPPPGHIPKRGARACTACRKGKNRCEGEVSDRSCLALPADPS